MHSREHTRRLTYLNNENIDTVKVQLHAYFISKANQRYLEYKHKFHYKDAYYKENSHSTFKANAKKNHVSSASMGILCLQNNPDK